ncbi:prostasin [Gastrophryne carolinensis]
MGRKTHMDRLLEDGPTAAIVSCQNPIHSRIVGGENADIATYPWQVNIKYQGDPACGGSLISSQWVVTACHCFPAEHALSDYDVVAGTTNLDPTDSGAQVGFIVDVIKNPNYNPNSYSYDVALVKLNTAFTLSSTVSPVKLPAAGVQIPAGLGCTITGWGNIRHSDPLPNPKHLQAGRVTVISRATCNCLYQIPPQNSITSIQSDMMCAGSVEGSVDACQGDSGGPLACYVQSNWYLVGVVSWGDECGVANRPGVYIAIVAYTDWIKSYVPEAQVEDFTVDQTPTPDNPDGCRAADGIIYPYPSSGATTVLATFIALPLYWLTAYLLTNL